MEQTSQTSFPEDPKHNPAGPGDEPLPEGRVPSAPGKPHLARLFAANVEGVETQTEGQAHYGAMPDVVLEPAEITPEIAGELRGITVTVPSINEWGVFQAVRAADDDEAEDPWVLTLDDRTLEVPASARVHVTSRAWEEAGGR